MAQPIGIPNFMGEPNCCSKPCKHIDCAAIRKHQEIPCCICSKKLERGDRYTYTEFGITHYLCAWRQYMLGLGVAAEDLV
jgi:hypothetical protein